MLQVKTEWGGGTTLSVKRTASNILNSNGREAVEMSHNRALFCQPESTCHRFVSHECRSASPRARRCFSGPRAAPGIGRAVRSLVSPQCACVRQFNLEAARIARRTAVTATAITIMMQHAAADREGARQLTELDNVLRTRSSCGARDRRLLAMRQPSRNISNRQPA